MTCKHKKTEYQPNENEWVCPFCGAESTADMEFCVEYSPCDDYHCEALHCGDEVYCSGCDETYTGEKIAKKMMEKKNAKRCPHCDGRGWL
jgi:hypothetical protein